MTGADTAPTRRHLTEIPELCALLPVAATTRTTIEGPRPPAASRPPVRLDIVHLQDTRTKHHDPNMAGCDPDRQGVLPYLAGWVHDIEADALDDATPHPDVPADLTVAGCCGWLTTMVTYAQTRPQWPNLEAGIRRTHANLRNATTGVRDIEHHYVPCQICGAGNLRERKPRLWQCGACGHEVSVIAATLPQARRALVLEHGDKAPTLRTLQNWAKRPGLLPGLLESGPRSNVYDMATIRSVTAAYLLKKGRAS